MGGIYLAHLALVNYGMARERGEEIVFRADDDLSASRDARRAAQKLGREATDGFSALGCIKLFSFVSPRVDPGTGYRGSEAGQVWEWKVDNDQGPPRPRPAHPADGSLSQASIRFMRGGEPREAHVIRFGSDGSDEAVADARRWIANRQAAVPAWFGEVASMEVAVLDPGTVADDGSVPPHAGEPFFREGRLVATPTPRAP